MLSTHSPNIPLETSSNRRPEDIQERLNTLLEEAKPILEDYEAKKEKLKETFKSKLGPYILEAFTLNPPKMGRPKSDSTLTTFAGWIEQLGISRSWAYEILNAERSKHGLPTVKDASQRKSFEAYAEDAISIDGSDPMDANRKALAESASLPEEYPEKGDVAQRKVWLQVHFQLFYRSEQEAKEALDKVALAAQFSEYKRLLKNQSASLKEAA